MQIQSFVEAGFAVVDGVISAQECDLLAKMSRLARQGCAGSRGLLSEPWCARRACKLRSDSALSALIPDDFVVVGCTYFEKSLAQNWLVPVHQDLSIPVAQRVAEPALTGWSVKEHTLYVQPPLSLLNQLIAIRLHLEACGDEDGPLRVIPGSHTIGIVSPQAAALARKTGPEVACVMQQGAALAMKPLLLHSSSKATGTSRRRVLHFVFGPPNLPFGLRWQVAA